MITSRVSGVELISHMTPLSSSPVIDLTDEPPKEVISIEDSTEPIKGKETIVLTAETSRVTSKGPILITEVSNIITTSPFQSYRQKQASRAKTAPLPKPIAIEEVSVVKTVRLPPARIPKRPKPILISSSGSRSKPNIPTVPIPAQPDKKCPICFDVLKNPSVTLCGHVYCTPCIKAAVGAAKQCPICRRKITSKGFHPLYL